MLETPIGKIEIYLDDIEVNFKTKQVYNELFTDVTTYHLTYKYNHDNKNHALKCILCDADIEGYSEGGESIETIAFDSLNPCVRLSIGIDGEFFWYEVNGDGKLEACDYFTCKYDGSHLSNGLEIYIKNGNIEDFIFSVAWMYNYNDENSHHTWYMADPACGK